MKMIEEYRGIWVAGLEDEKASLTNVSLELLSKAVQLAKKRGTDICFAVIADKIPEIWIEQLKEVGCNNILMLKARGMADDFDFRAGAFSQAIEKYKPEIVLFPASADGRDLAPKISARLKTGLTADCTDLDIAENGELLQIRPTYGGNIIATIRTPEHRPQMASVRPGVFEIDRSNGVEECLISEMDILDEKIFGRIKFINAIDNIGSFADLNEAEIVLAGGYGMGSKENFQLLYKLADKIGAAVAATRKVVDEGWAPSSVQVGQTGKVIAPTLYIAFGVSGALQHTLGIKRAKKIIAVNNDPAAPIFGICDKAILANAVEVVKKMVKEV
jgi:electron transfer flavoprotein alpha subunit